MTIRCVLFDLFGTLVQYDAGRVNQDFSKTHEFINSLQPDIEYDELLRLIDQIFTHLDSWSEREQREFSMLAVAEALFEALELSATESQWQFAHLYTLEWSRAVTPVHGVQALLSRCAKQFTTGLITNTHFEPMVDKLLSDHGINGFAQVTTSVTHGRPKPHPEIFIDTLRVLGVEPQECVYVGDNYRADFLGATAVGMQCYLIGQHARVPREYQIPTVIDLPLHLLK